MADAVDPKVDTDARPIAPPRRGEPVPPEFAAVKQIDRVTPESCEQLADAGEATIRVLERWGLRRARGALADAVRHLRRVAASGSYGREVPDWDHAAAAVRLVADWYHIAASLPSAPVAAIAEELARALRRDNGDIRTQFRLGVHLAQAGLSPRAPGGTSRRPDFFVTAGGTELALEVKTAQTRVAVLRAIESAAEQIRDAGHVGVVAVDVSAALGASHFTTGCYRDRVHPTDQFRPRFGSFAKHIVARFAGKRGRGRYGVVSGLVLYARTLSWHESDPRSPVGADHTYAGYVGGAHEPEVEAASCRVRDALLESLASSSITPPIRI